jgi:hypothetical protein
MGLRPEEFLVMRPADFWLKVQGYRETREEDFKVDAELTRMQTTELINIQLEPYKRLKPEQLWKFPWDKKNEDEPEFVTQEENEENLRSLIDSLPE